MKILVTGKTGFIGSSLITKLEADGCQVIAHGHQDGAVEQTGALNRYEACDYLVHLAGNAVVPESITAPQKNFQSNIMGMVSALEYARATGASLIFPSTIFVRGTSSEPQLMISPYHESKRICEDLGRFYAGYYGVSVTVLRLCNVYGPGQNPQALLPTILSQLADPAVSEIVVADLTPQRDYVYLEDVIRALSCCMQNNSCARQPGFRLLDIGSGQLNSVEQVIKAAMQATGITKPYRASGQQRQNDASSGLTASLTAAQDEIGYAPRYSLLEGLVDWLAG